MCNGSIRLQIKEQKKSRRRARSSDYAEINLTAKKNTKIYNARAQHACFAH